MKAEDFFEILGELDDGFVVRANQFRGQPRQNSWKGLAAAAACLLMMAGAIMPFALAAGRGECVLSLLPWEHDKCAAPVEDGDTDSLLPPLVWDEQGTGMLSPDSLQLIEFNGAYYEGLNMADTALLDTFNLPHRICENDLLGKAAEVVSDGGKAVTVYAYMPDQEAVYIAECEGKYTFAVFCNRVREDLTLYDTAEELFAIYGIHRAEDIQCVEIGERKLTSGSEIAAFYNAMCSAQGMGNAAWNTVIFNGLSEKESANLCVNLADTMQEIRMTSTRGLKANGAQYYPTIRYVEWAINYYALSEPIVP